MLWQTSLPRSPTAAAACSCWASRTVHATSSAPPSSGSTPSSISSRKYVRARSTRRLRTGPLLRLLLPTADGEEEAVIKVEVPRSLFVHRSPGGFLHRVADSKRPMSTEHLARMFQQRSQTPLIRFDGQIVNGASIEDLAPPLWERFRTPRSDDEGGHVSAQAGHGRSGGGGDAEAHGLWGPDGERGAAPLAAQLLRAGGSLPGRRDPHRFGR